MVSCAISSWTLTGLVRSFLDLTLAYFLLCGSTLGYFAWKFCDVFGIQLPCLCSGFFGYQHSNLCWHNLLIQWPRRKICSVQNLALNRLPFHLVSFNDRELNSNDVKFSIGVIELEGKVCSTSLSGVRLQTVVDNDNGYDTKGKLAMNQKQKSGARRRQRTAFGNGKLSPVLLSDSFPPSTVAGVSCSSYISGGETRSEIKDNFGSVAEIDESLPDDKNTQTGTDLGETSWHGFGLSSGEEKGSNLTKKSTCINNNEKSGFIGGEADRIRMLEQALEKKKAKLAAIYLELEKERAASASASDETISMILRLEEDKASIQMEARQYNEEQQPSVRLGRGEDPLVMVKQAGNTGLCDEKEVGTVDYDDIASQEIATKTVQGIEKTSLTAEEELKKNADFSKSLDCNVQHPTSDVEPAIYDVHVVDDKLDIPESSKESKTPPDSALDHKTSLYKFRRTFSGVSNEMLAYIFQGRLQQEMLPEHIGQIEDGA
ncbi:Detected protein of unknown function [Hibiscus syriacus]|uniref:GTD-binding domain-containing protein n=1 Tax=Hibiscus syriacus TaxID=106335 RepID=A0A6A2Z2A8_HIBSY|nr:probable myosin-binding protein 6 [Hibiscus syriacus]KAE8686071.1 Detected protein of unknown function [Hibiscus syriacus]